MGPKEVSDPGRQKLLLETQEVIKDQKVFIRVNQSIYLGLDGWTLMKTD